MVTAVGSRSTIAATPQASASGTRTPSLDAELNSARAQLEDWVTCPSAKTPEGKAKIKEVTAKFDSIKAQIAKEAKTADLASDKLRSNTAAAGLTAVQATSDIARQNRPNAAIGGNIDVYA